MFLLLDNYDSFVHNLARYLRRCGCKTEVRRSDQITPKQVERLAPTGILISPGPKRPEEAGCSVEVVQRLSDRIPILGICLGHQAIGVAFGARVAMCGPVHGSASRIDHDRRGLFTGCRQSMKVGRYHSLAINDAGLPGCLQVTAQIEDRLGERQAGLIMGVRHRWRPTFGLQFHPESVLTEQGMRTIRNFVVLAGAFRAEQTMVSGITPGVEGAPPPTPLPAADGRPDASPSGWLQHGEPVA